MIARHGDADVNDDGRLLLQLCCNNALFIINTFFQHRDTRRCTWRRHSLGQRSLIHFYIVSARAAELLQNKMAPELSVFVSMATAPELCFFITWLRLQLRSCVFFTWLRSGCALLIHFNNFGIPSVLFVASVRVIPTYFELILNTATTTRPAQSKSEGVWSWVVGVGKNYFLKIRLRADPLLADCHCLCPKKVRKRHTLRFYTKT